MMLAMGGSPGVETTWRRAPRSAGGIRTGSPRRAPGNGGFRPGSAADEGGEDQGHHRQVDDAVDDLQHEPGPWSMVCHGVKQDPRQPEPVSPWPSSSTPPGSTLVS